MDSRYRPRSHLAPLEPDAFLRWAWERGDRAKGTSPLTLDDLAFELGPDYPADVLRRDYVRLAARVRRNQRLNRDPWEGVG